MSLKSLYISLVCSNLEFVSRIQSLFHKLGTLDEMQENIWKIVACELNIPFEIKDNNELMKLITLSNLGFECKLFDLSAIFRIANYQSEAPGTFSS